MTAGASRPFPYMTALRPADLARRLQAPNPPRLLDVREPAEAAIASLPDARLIPLAQLPRRADELVDWQDDEIVVYCHHGIRSAHAIQYLQALGFERLTNLTGGIDAWSRQVDPTLPTY